MTDAAVAPAPPSASAPRSWRARAAFAARVVTWLWLARLVLAWLVSRPLAVFFSAGLDDDRVLFEPGALWLTEVLRLRFDQLDDTLGTTFGLVAFAWIALSVVSTWLCALLAHVRVAKLTPEASAAEALSGAPARRTAITEAFGRTLRVLPRLAGLGLTWGVFAGVFVLVGGMTLSRLYDGPLSRATAVTRDGGLLVGLAFLMIVVAVLSVFHDLARARLVAQDDSLGAAFWGALGAVRRRFLQVAGARLLLAVFALGLTWMSATLTNALAVEHEGTLRLWAVAFLHQATAWLLAGAHVAWLWLTLYWTTLRWTSRPQA